MIKRIGDKIAVQAAASLEMGKDIEQVARSSGLLIQVQTTT
jgi:hypothetical protein